MKLRWQKVSDWCYRKGDYTITHALGTAKPYSIWFLRDGKYEKGELLGHFADKQEAIACQELHSQQEASNAQSDTIG